MFQSTHPGWGATETKQERKNRYKVSIHAPRVGCDKIGDTMYIKRLVSIHAPRVGCDGFKMFEIRHHFLFQSTHPGWGATTKSSNSPVTLISFQSTHPGWGATIYLSPTLTNACCFNPRTPGGVRHKEAILNMGLTLFQSTHPGWGATTRAKSMQGFLDLFQSTHPGWGATFSHSPPFVPFCLFQSTHPGWGATQTLNLYTFLFTYVSIHAPRVGCDLKA